MKLKQSGIALIQTVVAVVVLGAALSGVFLLMGTVVEQSSDNRSRIIATYLTQECLERSRNARDSAWKQSVPWDCPFRPQAHEASLCSATNSFFPYRFASVAEGFVVEARLLPANEMPTEVTDISETDALIVQCETNWGDESLTMDQILTHWRQR